MIQVPKLPAALPDKLQQTTTRVKVVLVRLQVGRQILDALRQDRDLHFRRACVRRVDRVVLDELFFALLSQQPSSCVFLCLSCEHR